MRAEDNNEKQRAFHAALKYLAQRPRTVAQVRARLGPRFAETTVAAVTDRLRHEGLLNDEAFASLWQESREHHRPRSAALIRKELLERGISREVADLTVASVDDEAAGYRAGLHHARRLDGADYGTFQLPHGAVSATPWLCSGGHPAHAGPSVGGATPGRWRSAVSLTHGEITVRLSTSSRGHPQDGGSASRY